MEASPVIQQVNQEETERLRTAKVIDSEEDFIEHCKEVKVKTARVSFVLVLVSLAVIAVIYGIFIPIVRAGVNGLPS